MLGKRLKMRGKMLLLLLSIALIPMIASSAIHRVSMLFLGNHLAADTRTTLTENAIRSLQQLVEEYEEIMRLNKNGLELALRFQAQEVERRLAGPADLGQLSSFPEEYGRDEGLEAPQEPFREYLQAGPTGDLEPISVNYRQQGYFLCEGVKFEEVADDMSRLASMTRVYGELARFNPELIYWQYTTLEKGVLTIYPAGGTFPDPNSFDPRQRQWYVRAKEEDALTWHQPIIDVVSKKTILQISTPVRYPDGAWAGVTAMDIALTDIFQNWQLPAPWSEVAERLLAVPASPDQPAPQKPLIIAKTSYRDLQQTWETPLELQYLESEDQEELDALLRDAEAGRSGVRQMRFEGREALWACGVCRPEEPFPVIIVPYDNIIAQATAAEQYIISKTNQGLIITGVIMIIVFAAAALAAILSSRSVTRPISELVAAGKKLSLGDFKARVNIRTGDELQELGEIFNDTGPKLQERQRIKHSLALVTAIQQHLLPQEAPRLQNFDIFGQCRYCDETGGDYYDFIELVEIAEGKIGLTVGDITGHGLGAAFLMASARGVLRSDAVRRGTDLPRLFGDLNSHLVRDLEEGRFMTLFYAILDDKDRTLIWASAGHDPALWYHKDSGQFEELPNTGLPLGVLPEASFEQGGPVTFQSGDILLVGTDGIWEAINSSYEMFGKQRFYDTVRAHHDVSAAKIYTAVIRAVHDFCAGAPQMDDITLLTLKVL
ncbi:MAG: hypothetical protein AMJ79_04830 [Phycisphaerae bacterium SM23_30]|nr:MAG: hypothetical protein AMJ79_04830 [Phycisphaerae bacterium SM23_30]